MRLKTYIAPGMTEAMHRVRQELGEDAIIVSTHRDPDGQVRVTAALESNEGEDTITRLFAGGARPQVAEAVREALAFHGVPGRLTERLVNAVRLIEVAEPVMACAAALDATFAFAPLPDKSAPRPFLFIGPPGSGKTITVAKLAARSVLKNRRVAVVTTDTVRAGGAEQLAAFTRILEIDLKIVRSPEALKRTLEAVKPGHDLVFVDTPGLNPFSERDLNYLGDLAQAEVEPILVLAAGGDTTEAAEMGEAYAELGATRLLATRLDATRRLGAILAAADAAQAMFCEVTTSPHVAGGLTAINPVTLARLLLPEEEAARAPVPHVSEAVS